jgi:hypothetical protein
MQVDHRRGKTAVTQQTTDSHQVDSGFQHAGRKTVTKSVGRDGFVDLGLSRGQVADLLNYRFVQRHVVGFARE